MNLEYVPDRGHLIWLTFDPQAGHEQAGRRPALVTSPSSYNKKVGLFLACPITNQEKGYPFEVKIPAGKGVTGVILTDQIKSLDWRSRNAEYIDQLPNTALNEVMEKINALLK